MKDPGDYYRDKAELARALRAAITQIRAAQQIDHSSNYEAVLRVLQRQLEMAEYVGD